MVTIAISGCLSMSHLFVDTFFELGVVEEFVYRARITVILILQIYSAAWACDYDYVLQMMTYYYFRFCPSSAKCTKYRSSSSYSCLVILPFSVSNMSRSTPWSHHVNSSLQPLVSIIPRSHSYCLSLSLCCLEWNNGSITPRMQSGVTKWTTV